MAAVPTAKSVNPLLVRYLSELAANPLRTKALTTGVLQFLQEVLGSNIAGVPPKRLSKDASLVSHLLARFHVDIKAFKMLLYGLLVSAPLGHVLVGTLQRAFAGKTSTGAKLGQLLASNLFVAPIQAAAFLASMAVINGVKTTDGVVKAIKAGLLAVLRVTWVVSPTSMIIAQNFIPVELWVPFFNAVQFVVGTYMNTKVKQARLAAMKKEKAKDDSEKSA